MLDDPPAVVADVDGVTVAGLAPVGMVVVLWGAVALVVRGAVAGLLVGLFGGLAVGNEVPAAGFPRCEGEAQPVALARASMVTPAITAALWILPILIVKTLLL